MRTAIQRFRRSASRVPCPEWPGSNKNGDRNTRMKMKTIAGLVAIALLGCTAASRAAETTAVPMLIKPAQALDRMSPEQAREAQAYSLGVQTVLWGMQWVKASRAMYGMAGPVPPAAAPRPNDQYPHLTNV